MKVIDEPAVVAGLHGQVAGAVFTAGDPGWDEEVSGFNAAVTHTPAAVVVAAAAGDVQAAIRYAATAGMPVGVQATGHGAMTPIEDGVLISTRRLRTVSIDPARRSATVQAGVRWRQVIDAAAPYGLAPLNGSASGVGAVGYTLGGGLPVMARTFGFAADHVRALDVVTADGQLRHVEAETEPDLFWGLCGGGGNLGVVTAMTIGLVPVVTVYGGGIFYPAVQIPAVLSAWRDWCPDLPETITTSVAILRLPPVPELPEPLRGQIVAQLRFCAVGAEGMPVDTAKAAQLLAPMRAAAPVLLDTVADIPYTAIDAVHMDPDHPIPFCQRGLLLDDVTPGTIQALLAVAGPGEHVPLVVCEIRQLGGALRCAPAGGNAVGGRDAAYSLSAVGLLTPDTADITPATVDAVLAAAAPWTSGHTLLNLHGTVGDDTDRARPWETGTYQRLASLVTRYDPAGLLRYGHTIARTHPSAASTAERQ
jgi:FAD binding domain-containing protein